MNNNELICYAKFFILQLEYKKSMSNNETKVKIDTIIGDMNNDVIPDISRIKSKRYIIEYGEIIQDFATEYGINIPSFVNMEWKPIYRNMIINDILN